MKKITVLRGQPGSGKSTWAKQNRPHIPVCSADHFFCGDGENPHEYRFDFRKLGEAHGACLQKFIKLTSLGCDVVVDNTNTTAVEMAPYVAWGLALGFEVEIIRLECSSDIAAARNIHGVPAGSVYRMKTTLDSEVLPPFWPKEVVVKTG
jgi:predicted kinase